MDFIDFHILAQAVTYFLIFVCGFAVCIPVGVTRIEFQGQCILYGTFTKPADVPLLQTTSAANCNFPIYFSVFCLIFYGLGTSLYNFYAVIKSCKDPNIGSQMWVMPFLLTNLLLGLTTFVMACIISVGFKQFCDQMLSVIPSSKCSALQHTKWKGKDGDFTAGAYSELLTTSIGAAWVCVLLWVIQLGLGGLRFYRNRKQRSDDPSSIQRIGELEPTA